MIEASSVLISAENRIRRVSDDFLPRLRDVRRVPVRYQRMLPLSVIKRYQCVVLGATSHILTLGVIGHLNEQRLGFLRALTGMAIFPVLVEPEKMSLLIARIERYQRFRQRYSRASYVLQLPFQMRQFLFLHERERA